MNKMKKWLLVCVIAVAAVTAYAGGKKDGAAGSTGTASAEQAVPQRIVSLSPAGTEVLCAVGAYDQIVARTDFCNYPPEISAKPSVGGFAAENLSIETILAYRPDFVYGTSGTHDLLVSALENAGVTVYLSNANSVQAVLDEIRHIGTYTGHSDLGELVAAGIEAEFSAVAEKLHDKPTVRVYYEVWGSPLMSIGSKSFINDIVQAAGGDNIFAALPEAYPMVSEESIVARNPQVIIVPNMNGETKKSISERNGWQGLAAVTAGAVYFIDSDVFSRPGPRVTEALLSIAQLLHPDVEF